MGRRFNPIEMICEAIDADDRMSDREKRVAKANLRFRPFVRMRAKRIVKEEFEKAEALTADGNVEAQFDWMELLKLLLPLILAFI